MVDWTEARVEILRENVKAGEPFSEVARRIGGGCSRNAAIGKALRLGIRQPPSLAVPKHVRVADPVSASVLAAIRAARSRSLGKAVAPQVPAKPKPGPAMVLMSGARLRLHTALTQFADTQGLVNAPLADLSAAAGVSQGGWKKTVDALVAGHMVQVVRRGKGKLAPVYRVFSQATPPDHQPPAPSSLPPPVRRHVPRSLGPKPKPQARDAQPQRVQPITAQVLAWCRAYLARGVKLDFLAFCFDLDEDDLAAAVRA